VVAVTEIAPTGSPGSRMPARSMPRLVRPGMVVLVAYLVLGLVAFWPVDPGVTRRLFGISGDYTLSVWFLGWLPHALSHGINPFFSNAMFVPTGVNLAQNTESPFLGLLAAPITFAFGPAVSTNLLMIISMPLSAFAAYVVLRKWHVRVPAAALGGLIYGFSPYMVGQAQAHVVFIFLPLPPLIVYTLACILQGRGTPARRGLQLGLLLIAQFFISPEILAIVGILTVVALLCMAVRFRAHVPAVVWRVATTFGLAFVVTGVLLAYPAWMLLAGPQHFTGTTRPLTNGFHNDLLNFVVPGPLQKVSLGMRSMGTRLAGGDSVEAGGYIGVPLLILAGYLAWRSRRRRRTQLAAILLFVTALLSLGPYLAVNGRLTHIPLPFLLLDHLPLLDNILPVRISFAVGACLAAVVAFGLDDANGSDPSLRAHGRRGTALVGVALVALVATQLPRWPYTAPTAVSLPAAIRQAVPKGDPVAITYPFATNYTSVQPLLWQAEDKFAFRLIGGYAYHPDSHGHADILPSPMKPRALQAFLVGQQSSGFGGIYGLPLPVSPELVAATRRTLLAYDIRLVIVNRATAGSGPVMELFDDALGVPTRTAGQFSVWTNWHGVPKHQVFPALLTQVIVPRQGGVVSNITALDAVATDYRRITGVDFLLTGGNERNALIAAGRVSTVGWVAKWKTTSVPNGTYMLQSVAHDSAGRTTRSPPVTITVKN
jgi:hypothetical protein